MKISPFFAFLGLFGLTIACSNLVSHTEGENSYPKAIQAVNVGDAKSHKSQVLMYYANETIVKGQYSNDYNRIVTALKNNREALKDLNVPDKDLDQLSADLQTYGETIEADKSCLTSLIDFEVEALKKNICDNPKNKNLGLIVFRSSLLQEGRFLYCKPGGGAQVVEFPALKSSALANNLQKYPLLDSNPAVYSPTLVAALLQTADTFDFKKEKSSINLVIKSHGKSNIGQKSNGKDLTDLDSILVAPRIPITWNQVPGQNDREKQKNIVQIFWDNMKKIGRVPKFSCPSQATMNKFSLLGSGDGLGAEGFATEGFSAEGFGAEGFGTEGFGAEGFGAEGFESLGTTLGQENGWITKRAFLTILKESRFNFPVIVTESCDSYWGDVVAESKLPLSNVGTIFGSGKNTNADPNASTVDYLNVSYNQVFQSFYADPEAHFSNTFQSELQKISN